MNNTTHMPKRAVYTALIGNYDRLSPIKFPTSVKFVAFTDRSDLSVQGWEMRNVADFDSLPTGLPNWMVNRYIKMHPHLLLDSYHETLYVDANVALVCDPKPLFDRYLCSSDIAIPLHMDRKDIRDELDECLRLGKIGTDDWERMALRLNFYESQDMPQRLMTENNVIFRRDCNAVRQAMDHWWKEIGRGITRDQLALPYALHMAGLAVAPVHDGPRISGKFMTIRPHWPDGRRRNVSYLMRAISALRHRSRLHRSVARVIDRLVAIVEKVRRKCA